MKLTEFKSIYFQKICNALSKYSYVILTDRTLQLFLLTDIIRRNDVMKKYIGHINQ